MASGGKARRYPLVEWVSAAIGLAITGGMFGFLAYEAMLQRNGAPPIMKVVPVAVVHGAGLYVLEVDVTNISHQTGAAVEVEGTLEVDGEAIETSSATVTYVPGGSLRRAGLVFTHDPRRYKLGLRVTGYERP